VARRRNGSALDPQHQVYREAINRSKNSAQRRAFACPEFSRPVYLFARDGPHGPHHPQAVKSRAVGCVVCAGSDRVLRLRVVRTMRTVVREFLLIGEARSLDIQLGNVASDRNLLGNPGFSASEFSKFSSALQEFCHQLATYRVRPSHMNPVQGLPGRRSSISAPGRISDEF
jgi:hypothetical protein